MPNPDRLAREAKTPGLREPAVGSALVAPADSPSMQGLETPAQPGRGEGPAVGGALARTADFPSSQDSTPSPANIVSVDLSGGSHSPPQARRGTTHLEEGQELRGYQFKLYPTQEQSRRLFRMQKELRVVWNLLVEDRLAHLDAMIARAILAGAIPPLLERPPRSAPKPEFWAWQKLRRHAERDSQAYVKRQGDKVWSPLTLHAAVYKPLMARAALALGGPLIASIEMVRAVITHFGRARIPKTAPSWRPPRFKHAVEPWHDYTMLQERSGSKIAWGTFGPRGWHNVEVRFGGMRLCGRAWRDPLSASLCQGMSVTRQVDGWFGSVRFKCAPKERPAATLGRVGVVFGRELLAVMTDGRESRQWDNPRDGGYTRWCAYLDQQISEAREAGDTNRALDLELKKMRHQLHMARKTKNLWLTEIAPVLGQYSRICVGHVLGTPHRALTEDDEAGGTQYAGEAIRWLLERYGDRVVKLDLPGVSDAVPEAFALELLNMDARLQAAE